MARHGTRTRTPFDPALLRAMLGAGADATQVQRATIGWDDDGGAHFQLDAAAGLVLVRVTTDDGAPLTCRLLAPGGFWAIPARGDECHVLHAAGEHRTVGAPIALWTHRGAPSGLDATTKVLDVPGALKVGAGAAKGAARVDDATNDGTLAVTQTTPSSIRLTFTPPGGAPQSIDIVVAGAAGVTITAAGSLSLSGKVAAGSAKTTIE